MKLFIALTIAVSTISSCYSHTCHTSLNFTFANGDYSLTTYTINTTTIGFDITVNTTGWVGLALSDNITSDLVIGGVKDGTEENYVFDMHAQGNQRPENDTKNESDWRLMNAFQDDEKKQTKLTYHRLLKTADPNKGEDIEITMEGLYIVWSYWQTDDVNYRGQILRGQSENKENLLKNGTAGGFIVKGSFSFVFCTVAYAIFKSL